MDNNYSALIYCSLFELAQSVYVINENTNTVDRIVQIDGFNSIIDFCHNENIHKLTLVGVSDFVRVMRDNLKRDNATKYSNNILEIEVQETHE